LPLQPPFAPGSLRSKHPLRCCEPGRRGRLHKPTGRVAIRVLALLVVACASHRPPVSPDRAGVVPSIGTTEEGIASWYGPGYAENRTFCGDRFDPDDLTAAHPSWACGTRVRVTLLATGRSAVVTINDRFGAHKRRVIDVSKEAAKLIGLIGPGTGQVTLEVVE
jgi:rare lipoprotein A